MLWEQFALCRLCNLGMSYSKYSSAFVHTDAHNAITCSSMKVRSGAQMHRDDMVSIFADLLFMTQIRLHLSVDSLERSNRVHQIEIWTVYPAGFYSILTLTQFLYTRCMGKKLHIISRGQG